MVGDLNSEPDTGAIRYLASGQVKSSHPEWEAHAAFAWGDAVLLHPLLHTHTHTHIHTHTHTHTHTAS